MLAFLRSPRMKAASVMCTGLLLTTGALLPLPPVFRVLFCAIAGAIAMLGLHGTLWVFEVPDAPVAPYLVRGLPETVAALGEKWGVTIPAARAYNWTMGAWLPPVRLVARVQLQFPFDHLDEPWPRVRYVLALALATTRRHRLWRWPVVATGAIVGCVASLLLMSSQQANVGQAGATLFALILEGFLLALGWRITQARLARQVLLVEEDVERGLEWLIGV